MTCEGEIVNRTHKIGKLSRKLSYQNRFVVYRFRQTVSKNQKVYHSVTFSAKAQGQDNW